jgi:hypothetical protein
MGSSTGRRAIAAVAGILGALVFAAAGGTAHAAAGQALHYKLRGDMAQAFWQHGRTVTFLDAESDDQFGTDLFYDSFTVKFDKHGDFAGGTDVSGEVAGNRVQLSVDKHLDSATLVARMRVTSCHVKPSGDAGRCVPAGKIRIELTFTGVGLTGHGGSNDHFHQDGVTINDHLVGAQRNATVAGTIGGTPVRARDLAGALIAHVKGGGLFICHGC